MKYCLFIFIMAAISFAGCRADMSGSADLESGIRGLEQGRNEYGLKMLQRAIARGLDVKQEALAHNCAGIAHWRLGKHDMAILAFETGMELDPWLPDPIYNMGVIKLELGDLEGAARFFEKAASVESDGTRALEYLAHVHVRLGDPQRARAALEEALARVPRSPRIITALAVLDLQAGRVERAVAGFQHALEHDAAYPPAIYNLGAANKSRLENRVQARAYFEEYLNLEPTGLYAERARALLEDIEETKLIAEREAPSQPPVLEKPLPRKTARKEKPVAEPPPPESGYNEYMLMARALEQQGRVEAAVHNYLRAAMMAGLAGEHGRKENALDRAVPAAGDNARAHYALAMYFMEQDVHSTALAHLKRSAELSHDWAEPHLALAGILAEMGEVDAAVVCLRRADRVQPDKPDALWALAQLHDRRTGLTNQAVQCYSWFVRRFPEDPRAAEALERLDELQ